MSRQPDEFRNAYTSPSATATESLPTAGNSSGISRGRIIVLVVASAIIGLSALTIAFYVFAVGPQKLPVQFVRFALTVGLMVCVYRGFVWARAVTVLLMGLGCVGSAITALTMEPEQSVILRSIMGIYVLVYGGAAAVLLFSSSVREFLNSQLDGGSQPR
jgi:hypothetical protein